MRPSPAIFGLEVADTDQVADTTEIPEAALFIGDPHAQLRFVIRELGRLGDDDTAARSIIGQ